MSHAKTDLRRVIDARLRALDRAAVRAASQAICARLDALPAVRAAAHLACFAAFGQEIDLGDLAAACATRGQQLYYPRFDRERKVYDMVPVSDPARDLRPGHWGVREPAGEIPPVAEAVRLHDMAWLVPGLAFDAQGHRLGRGAGYYDRLLAGAQGLRIGVAHACQLVDHVPVTAHDVSMNLVVTELQVYACGTRPEMMNTKEH